MRFNVAIAAAALRPTELAQLGPAQPAQPATPVEPSAQLAARADHGVQGYVHHCSGSTRCKWND